MKNKIAVGMVMLIAFIALPFAIETSYSQDIEKMMKMAKAIQEWAVIGTMYAYIEIPLNWSMTLYEEKEISAEDCVKIAQAVKSMAEVLEKRAAKTKDPTLRKESVAYAKSIIAEVEAYVKYYQGDKKSLEAAEKQREKAEAHLETISNYLSQE